MAAKVLNIEIGKRIVKVCVSEKKGKAYAISDNFIFPTPDGAVLDGQIVGEVIMGDKLLQELARRDIKANELYLSVASSKIATREITIPAVKDDQIKTVVLTNATDYLPIDVTKYQIDTVLLERTEEECRVLVVAVPSIIVESYIALADYCGFVIRALDFSGNSQFQVLKGIQGDGVNMFVTVDPDTTTVTFVENGELLMQRALPLGGDEMICRYMGLKNMDDNEYLAALSSLSDDPSKPRAKKEEVKVKEEEENEEEYEEVEEYHPPEEREVDPVFSGGRYRDDDEADGDEDDPAISDPGSEYDDEAVEDDEFEDVDTEESDERPRMFYGNDDDEDKEDAGEEEEEEEEEELPTYQYQRYRDEERPERSYEEMRILEECLTKLVSSIIRSVDFFHGGKYAQKDLERIILMGSCAHLSDLREQLSISLGVETLWLEEVKDIQSLANSVDDISIYIGCLGARVAPLDLLPEEYIARTGAKRRAGINGDNFGIVAIVAGAVIAFILIGYSLGMNFYKTRQLNKINAQIADLQYAEAAYKAYLSYTASDKDLQKFVDGSLNRNAEIRAFFEEMEEKMPSDIVVLTANCTDAGVSMNVQVPGFEEAASVIRQFRSFSSIDVISVTSIAKADGDGGSTASFTISCSYVVEEEPTTKAPVETTETTENK